MHATRWLPVALALVASAAPLSAQDVEMLGRRYGTTPPGGYFREIARNPNAFRFTRGRASPERALEAPRALGGGGAAGVGAVAAPAQAIGPRGQPVVGTFRIPVVLGRFSDVSSSPPFTPNQIQSAYFDSPGRTVTSYYSEVSRGNLTLLGDTRDWVSTTLAQTAVTQGESALVCCGIGTFIKQILNLQTGVDWGAYDNDGPDGLPNSGDDDGYVDALAVIHPTRGAECGGTGSSGRIWSHKWSLSAASGTGPFATTTARHGGGVIYIEDYFVQGAVSCDGVSLNEIGVFVHEAGHAFGLPDLYDTRNSTTRHNGAGNWDLMATGAWGCNGNDASRPCHMGAWSKAMLGWVTVTTLPPDLDFGTLSLPPVETSGSVYRADAGDGSGEYLLLENRQRVGYDQSLFAEGLLVWQIDANAVAARWAFNGVNAFDHMGVWLRQADGCDDLGRTGLPPFGCDTAGLRGDGGDPFPGQSLNSVFHAASNPGSISFAGRATGLTLLDIAEVGDDVSFRLSTRFTRLTVSSSGTSSGASAIFTVDGVTLPAPPANVVLSAPFARRVLEAAGGEVLALGERRPFLRWADLPTEPRARRVTTPLADATYVAEFGGTEYELRVDLVGGVNGVSPGSIVSSPVSSDLWFPPATNVTLFALPTTGFAFVSWAGALTDRPNPTSVVMDAPVVGGALFRLVYAVADVQLSVTATVAQDVQLVASSGTSPITWTVLAGTLPAGVTLSGGGRISGVPLDVGTFPLTVHVADARGLTATAAVTLEVAEPSLSLAGLAAPFLLEGPALGTHELAFLDHQGNRGGRYDLGDFRAWVLTHPALPTVTSPASATAPARTVEVPVHFGSREDGR